MFQVRLIADHTQHRLFPVRSCEGVDLLLPFGADGVQCPGVGQIVHQNNAVRVSIVTSCDGLEPLLSRGVPYLHGDTTWGFRRT